MGCDIHMYVEYKRKQSTNYSNFGGRINPGRNYYMFGILSNGVRSDNEKGFSAKGMPDYDSLGYSSRSDSQLYITDTEGDGYVTEDRAEEWVKSGSSVFTDERKKFVTHPDWHSHSWLTLEEYQKAMDIYNEHPEALQYNEPEYNAILAIMKSLENDGLETRVVFWFDN